MNEFKFNGRFVFPEGHDDDLWGVSRSEKREGKKNDVGRWSTRGGLS